MFKEKFILPTIVKESLNKERGMYAWLESLKMHDYSGGKARTQLNKAIDRQMVDSRVVEKNKKISKDSKPFEAHEDHQQDDEANDKKQPWWNLYKGPESQLAEDSDKTVKTISNKEFKDAIKKTENDLDEQLTEKEKEKNKEKSETSETAEKSENNSSDDDENKDLSEEQKKEKREKKKRKKALMNPLYLPLHKREELAPVNLRGALDNNGKTILDIDERIKRRKLEKQNDWKNKTFEEASVITPEEQARMTRLKQPRTLGFVDQKGQYQKLDVALEDGKK